MPTTTKSPEEATQQTSSSDDSRSENAASQFNRWSVEAARAKKKSEKNLVVEFVRYQNRWVRFVILSVLTVVLVAGVLALAYLSWFVWLPQLWNWGFKPLSFYAVLSVLGALYLGILPFVPIYSFRGTISGILQLYAEDAKTQAGVQLQSIEQKQANFESVIGQKDTEGLLPLVTYSRLELEQYYLIGIEQAQKSYNNSIVAMWVGFVIIIFGIVSYILPFSLVNDDLASGNFQILTIGSGIVIELVSALFLFIFRSSTNQLTYFYNRQIFIHNALLSYKMATSMQDPDTAKKMIIEKILEFGSTAKVKPTPMQGKRPLETGRQ